MSSFVTRLEESLYKSAPTLEAYQDESTLESRLQAIIKKAMVEQNAHRNGGSAAGTGGGSSIGTTQIHPPPGESNIKLLNVNAAAPVDDGIAALPSSAAALHDQQQLLQLQLVNQLPIPGESADASTADSIAGTIQSTSTTTIAAAAAAAATAAAVAATTTATIPPLPTALPNMMYPSPPNMMTNGAPVLLRSGPDQLLQHQQQQILPPPLPMTMPNPSVSNRNVMMHNSALRAGGVDPPMMLMMQPLVPTDNMYVNVPSSYMNTSTTNNGGGMTMIDTGLTNTNISGGPVPLGALGESGVPLLPPSSAAGGSHQVPPVEGHAKLRVKVGRKSREDVSGYQSFPGGEGDYSQQQQQQQLLQQQMNMQDPLMSIGSLPDSMMVVGIPQENGDVGGVGDTTTTTNGEGGGGGKGEGENNDADFDYRRMQILKQQRWLLFLRHCAKCSVPDGDCQYGDNCMVAKQLWQHLNDCRDDQCAYPRCIASRELLRHHQKCTSTNCPVCAPVKQYVSKQRQVAYHRRMAAMTPEQQKLVIERQQHMALQQQQQQQLAMQQYQQQQQQHQAQRWGSGGTIPTVNSEANKPRPSGAQAAALAGIAQYSGAPFPSSNPNNNSATAIVRLVSTSSTGINILPPGVAPPTGNFNNAPIIDERQVAKKPRTFRLQNMGTSLVEFFNAGEIKTHLAKLKCTPNSSNSSNGAAGVAAGATTTNKVFYIDGVPYIEEESCCKVCGLNKLTFEPATLYCFSCNQKIKRNQTFYATPPHYDIKATWCHPCLNEIKAEPFVLDNCNVYKQELIKKKNTEEKEESWVCCDRCEGWVHQICGLFNKGRNDEDRGYLCPDCLLHGLERRERAVPTERPQAMLSAEDLPSCRLSDALEKRLEKMLADDRVARAKAQGVPVESVPGAQGLTVRVVNNVMKRCYVKPSFHDYFKSDGFPDSFLYRQKVILLYQKIDGVDIALYCLYMQEYGDDCPAPNKNTLYLSYLDSVKYFQPEILSASGVALRTVVYHEILVGYLADAKQRGFCQMLIWACPPLAGDDYIWYCHPGKQKTPRSDRLREWYLAMLRRAKDEGIITYITNLYDTYFQGGKDHRIARPSIVHLPYFEGDYWPGEAENLLRVYTEETRQAGKKSNNSGSYSTNGNNGSGNLSKSRKAMKGKRFGSSNLPLDQQLLAALGDAIQGMREDFIIVHLQEECTFCRTYISDDEKYFHPKPPQKVVIKSERTFDGISLDVPGGEASKTVSLTRFQLCRSCYCRECQGTDIGTGAIKSNGDGSALETVAGLPNGIAVTDLMSVKCPPIALPSEIENNKDAEDLENEFFDTRTAFLSLCQGNHYQFDTLRRAKHSSMMVLYHLHNPRAPAFAATCNTCQSEIPTGEGFRCAVCNDFDMCNNCYKNPAVRHPHPLQAHTREIDETRARLTDSEAAERRAQLSRTMQLLVHASSCQDPNCLSATCAKVKELFRHAATCSLKMAGGCNYCRRMWALLQAHAKICTVSNCPVPRCQEMREMRRKQAARMDDQRRAAYRAMLQNQSVG